MDHSQNENSEKQNDIEERIPAENGESLPEENLTPETEEMPQQTEEAGNTSEPDNPSENIPAEEKPFSQVPNKAAGVYVLGNPEAPVRQSEQIAGTSELSEQKTKKEKKGASRGFVTAMVLLGILLSAGVGFGGGLLAARMNGNSESSGHGNVTINYVQGEKKTEGVITDMGEEAYVASIAADSVVEVTTETVKTSSYFGQYVTQGAGSGVIIDANGYILTCAHVISGASTVHVKTTDGTEYTAEVIGSDSQTDIAVLKIEGENLCTATIGDSDALVVGEHVVAIGNPLGELGGTVTSGIISALDRQVEIEGQSYNLLQTNAAINPGNSGGGLFDAKGNLIGIVNAKSAGEDIEGLAFAIPCSDAIEVAKMLITEGYVSGRPQLGFMLFEVTSSTDVAQLWEYRNYITDYGIYIASALSEDFHTGDRLIAIDGITFSSISAIKSALAEYEVGDEVTITISRINEAGKSEIMTIPLTLTESTGS